MIVASGTFDDVIGDIEQHLSRQIRRDGTGIGRQMLTVEASGCQGLPCQYETEIEAYHHDDVYVEVRMTLAGIQHVDGKAIAQIEVEEI